MAQAKDGSGKEPHKQPAKGVGKNDGISSSQSVPRAASIFKGPKQQNEHNADPNKKAGKFPG